MAENSKIEWTDHTHNFWVGCTEVSAACKFCYARSWAKRAGRGHLWEGQRERTKDWKQPLKWNTQARAAGVNAKVFTNSLADFFDNQADPKWRKEAWELIGSTPHLTWLILTKRPQNILKMLPKDWWHEVGGYKNVWLGCTVENQLEANRRIPHLLRVPARVHFLSCEPLLESVNPYSYDIARQLEGDADRERIDWIICGGEDYLREGRPFDLEWARDLRIQCAITGAKFFMKQVHKNVPIPADLMVREFPECR